MQFYGQPLAKNDSTDIAKAPGFKPALFLPCFIRRAGREEAQDRASPVGCRPPDPGGSSSSAGSGTISSGSLLMIRKRLFVCRVLRMPALKQPDELLGGLEIALSAGMIVPG